MNVTKYNLTGYNNNQNGSVHVKTAEVKQIRHVQAVTR